MDMHMAKNAYPLENTLLSLEKHIEATENVFSIFPPWKNPRCQANTYMKIIIINYEYLHIIKAWRRDSCEQCEI